MAKSKRQRADEAYLKTETLAGQIDAFDGVQGADDERKPIHDDGRSAPEICPHCFKRMDQEAGGKWTHLKQWRPEDGCRLQCNFCGGIVVVNEIVWHEVRELAIATFRDRKAGKLSNPRGRSDRGAR